MGYSAALARLPSECPLSRHIYKLLDSHSVSKKGKTGTCFLEDFERGYFDILELIPK
jgi:hypothetical protein